MLKYLIYLFTLNFKIQNFQKIIHSEKTTELMQHKLENDSEIKSYSLLFTKLKFFQAVKMH